MSDAPSVTLYLNRSTGVWHANVYWSKNHRVRPSLGVRTHAEALTAFEDFKRNDLPRIILDQAAIAREKAREPEEPKADPRIVDLVAWYCERHLADLGRSDGTVKKYESILGNFAVFCKARHIGRASQISYDRVTEFLDWLATFGAEKLHRGGGKPSGLSPKYRDNIKAIMRGWLYAAVEAGKLHDAPVKKWFISNCRKRVTDTFAMTPLELGECLTIIGWQAPHIANIVLFMAHTGCRVSDAQDLRWSQVSIEDRYARRRQIKTKNLATYSLNETSLGAVRAEMDRKAEKASHVFTNELGQPFSYNSLYRGFTRALERGDFTVTRDGEERTVDLKCLRHTYGTTMAHLGCPVFLLQRQMGHTRIETTLQYYHVDPEEGLKWSERYNDALSAAKPTPARAAP